jgi:dienelactone hydrolase
MRILTAVLTLSLAAAQASAAIQTKEIDYQDGGTTLRGLLAWNDKINGLKPGVLVIHQWMGLTDHEKKAAIKLAEAGYTAFAADIYGKGQAPKNQKEAGELAGKYKADRALYRSRIQAGLDTLKKQGGVDVKNLAVIGYCFGGGGALEAARANMDVKGVVSFHGSLDNPDAARPVIQPKVLVLHGAEDPYADAKQVAALEKELTESKADWQLVKYSGAVHAFTQPEAGNDKSKGAAYDAAADRRSWAALQAFFQELFSKIGQEQK